MKFISSILIFIFSFSTYLSSETDKEIVELEPYIVNGHFLGVILDLHHKHPFFPFSKVSYIEIEGVIKGSCFEQASILPGARIVAINNNRSFSEAYFNEAFGSPQGTELVMTVQNMSGAEEEKKVILTELPNTQDTTILTESITITLKSQKPKDVYPSKTLVGNGFGRLVFYYKSDDKYKLLCYVKHKKSDWLVVPLDNTKHQIDDDSQIVFNPDLSYSFIK